MSIDYSGQNLRGRSFKSRQDLAEANFSNTDIRGANFANSNLRGANFTHAKAGLQRRWAIVLVILSLLLVALSGVPLALAGWWIPYYLIPVTIQKYTIFPGLLVLTVLLCFLYVTTHQTKDVALGSIASISSVIVAGAAVSGVIAGTVSISLSIAITVIGAVAGIATASLAGAASVATVTVVAGTTVSYIVVIVAAVITAFLSAASAKAIASTGVVAAAVAMTVAGAGNIAIIAAASGGVFSILLSAYISHKALAGDEKHSLIRNIAVAVAAFSGTSFRNANLTDANFTAATLQSTDFRKANLTRTCFKKTKKLDCVYPGTTYLRNTQVRQLLVTGQGQDNNFDRKDLRGVNFQQANLVDASFIGADLSQANLQDTDLSRAKLVQAQLNGTDLTGATLTGAYVQDWGITTDTKFDGVRCEYIYMQLPTKENPDPIRKPDNNKEVFAPGEFEDFIQPIFDTLDLYHNQGVDPRAIAISFKQLAENHPDAELEIVAIEKRGQDKFLLRAKTAATSNHSELSAEYFDTYNEIKSLPEREIKLLLQEKDNQIRRLENMVNTALEHPKFYLETVNMGNVMMHNAGELKFGSITGGDVSINIAGSIDNVETINQVESIIEDKNIEIKLIKGRGMLVGKPSELLIQVTNFSEHPLNKTLEIELTSSAEYKILSSNPVYIPIIEPKQSEEISFLLEMNMSREIAVNYKVNGKLSNSAIYISAVNDNPYIYGSPVGDESAFVGREKELEQIIQAVIKPAKQDILVVGERRTGKTSLLKQLQIRINKPFIPVEVILNTTERTTEKILGLIFQKIVQTLVRQNLLHESDYTESDFPDLEFVENIKKILDIVKSRLGDLKIVLMLDEADSLLEVKQPSGLINELPQNILRAALQSSEVGNDLRVVMASTTDLAIYMSKRSSPLFNHFRKISLKPLSVEETEKLIKYPAAMLDYSYLDSAIQHINFLSGGQPYYCQALCYESFNQALQAKHNPITYEDISIAEEKVVDDLYEAYRSGFWQRFSEDEKYILQVLSENQSIDNSNQRKFKRLLDWQIVAEEQGTYSFASGLIQKWTTRALLE